MFYDVEERFILDGFTRSDVMLVLIQLGVNFSALKTAQRGTFNLVMSQKDEVGEDKRVTIRF